MFSASTMFSFIPPFWAVHISDGLLTAPWWVGGFIVAGLLALLGAWHIRDEEISKVALLTAAFFVTSLIHVPVPAGPRAHLLLTGLLGVVLGARAALAIPIGVFLQAALFQHGGYTTIGINSCVMALPALLSCLLFAALRRVPWVRRPWFRVGLVISSTGLFTLSLVYGVALLWSNALSSADELDTALADRMIFHPATLALVAVVAGFAAWLERRLENAPEFPLGLLIGETAVLVTVFLNCLVLLAGGDQNWRTPALISVVIHLPLAVIEGIVLGFTVGFIVRVKPEMLGWPALEKKQCTLEPLPPESIEASLS